MKKKELKENYETFDPPTHRYIKSTKQEVSMLDVI